MAHYNVLITNLGPAGYGFVIAASIALVAIVLSAFIKVGKAIVKRLKRARVVQENTMSNEELENFKPFSETTGGSTQHRNNRKRTFGRRYYFKNGKKHWI